MGYGADNVETVERPAQDGDPNRKLARIFSVGKLGWQPGHNTDWASDNVRAHKSMASSMTPAASATREVSTRSGSVMTEAEKAAAEEATAKNRREWKELLETDPEAAGDAMIEYDRCFTLSELKKMLRGLDLSGLTEVLLLASELKLEREKEQRVLSRVEAMMETMRDYDASLEAKTEAFERLKVIASEEGFLNVPSVSSEPSIFWGGAENFWEKAVVLMEEAVTDSRATLQSPDNVPHIGSAVPAAAAAAH